MISSYPKRKKIYSANFKIQRGMVTLAIALGLLMTMTVISLFSARFGVTGQKIISDQNRGMQALNAAEAGLEFGINYLNQNSAAIAVNSGNGYIANYSNSNTSNVSLSNGSKFTITYTNPVINNFSLIKVAATGINSDGSATRSLSQLVNLSPSLFRSASNPATVKGNITLSGNSEITNTQGSNTITAGGTVSLTSNAETITSSGVSSNSGVTGPDLSQNNSSIQSMTSTSFFANFFNQTSTNVENSVNYLYHDTSGTNYVGGQSYSGSPANGDYSSVLNGKSGTSIWVDVPGYTATLSGNTTIGTGANPVLLIINGNLAISGNLTIYGFVYVTGNFTSSGNSAISGGLAVLGNATDSGNYSLTYSSSVLNSVSHQQSSFVKVIGSWNDLGF